MTVERMRRAFGFYLKRRSELESIESARGTTFGIAVDKDDLALRYQSKRWGCEILRAYIEGNEEQVNRLVVFLKTKVWT